MPVRMMMAINSCRKERIEGGLDEYFSLARDFKRHFCLDDCAPHFVGVWDTVSSVGWIENPLSLPYTRQPAEHPIGRHAIAIDEKRAFFRTNLWHPTTGRRAEERQTGLVSGRALRCWRWVSRSRKRAVETGPRLDVREAKAAQLLVEPSKEDYVLGRAGSPPLAKPDADAKACTSR